MVKSGLGLAKRIWTWAFLQDSDSLLEKFVGLGLESNTKGLGLGLESTKVGLYPSKNLTLLFDT